MNPKTNKYRRVNMERKLVKSDYFHFMRVVRSAKLKGREKALLRTYADWYYWENQAPCIYGFDQIAAWTGVSRRTATRAHERLEELGWLITKRYGKYDPIRVWPTVGFPDPDYDNQDYSKAHRYSDSLEEVEWAEAFRSGENLPGESASSSGRATKPRGSHSQGRRQRGKSKSSPAFQDATEAH
jgi:hypothetical protein